MSEEGNADSSRGPWAQRGVEYVRANENDTSLYPLVETVRYLLDNSHIGIEQRTGIRQLIRHLEAQDSGMSRESFQHRVLIPLKQERIVITLVYPGPRGGVFIPRVEEEVLQAVTQILGRVLQELNNVEPFTRGLPIHATIDRLLAAARPAGEDMP